MLQLPKTFIDSVKHCQGFDEESFLEAHQTVLPKSIRLNPFKKTELNFLINTPVIWSDNGFYLAQRPNFTHDILFQAGCYYVQEAGSMFIEHVLKTCINFEEQLMVLDVCAAPGGKSTLINSLLNKHSVLVANEVVKQRADVLAQNINKWGTANVIVTNNDPTAFSETTNTFDIILADAPCSGSGLFRKQHDAIDEWSIDNVNLCCQRQKRILSDVISSLKEGGTLIYSTCSYSQAENEDIADWLIAEFDLVSIQIPIEHKWGIIETMSSKQNAFGYRFYPDKTNAEGFFCSVFIKKGDGQVYSFRKNKRHTFVSLKAKEKEVFTNWIADLNTHDIIKFKDDYLLTNELAVNFINSHPHLYLKKVGTNIGSIIKQDVIPNHDLALSINAAKAIQAIHCNEVDTLLFLKKELQTLKGNKGWNLIIHKGFGVGWIKHLGNRINNYLPNEYRILK